MILGEGDAFEVMRCEVEEIRHKGNWCRYDIEKLTEFIYYLRHINDDLAVQLKRALDTLEEARARVEFYRNATIPRELRDKNQ